MCVALVFCVATTALVPVVAVILSSGLASVACDLRCICLPLFGGMAHRGGAGCFSLGHTSKCVRNLYFAPSTALVPMTAGRSMDSKSAFWQVWSAGESQCTVRCRCHGPYPVTHGAVMGRFT